VTTIVPLATDTARPYLPAKDFASSKRFYDALGFRKVFDGAVAIYAAGGSGFILEDRWQQQWADNTTMQLATDDLDAWWRRLQALDLPATFGVPAPTAPAMQPWGLRVVALVDPAGVRWHFTERPAEPARG
jgi:uncharacterized glyoxalase superfamily protein PhnB